MSWSSSVIRFQSTSRLTFDSCLIQFDYVEVSVRLIPPENGNPEQQLVLRSNQREASPSRPCSSRQLAADHPLWLAAKGVWNANDEERSRSRE